MKYDRKYLESLMVKWKPELNTYYNAPDSMFDGFYWGKIQSIDLHQVAGGRYRAEMTFNNQRSLGSHRDHLHASLDEAEEYIAYVAYRIKLKSKKKEKWRPKSEFTLNTKTFIVSTPPRSKNKIFNEIAKENDLKSNYVKSTYVDCAITDLGDLADTYGDDITQFPPDEQLRALGMVSLLVSLGHHGVQSPKYSKARDDQKIADVLH